jgi:hypothetical protein
MSEIPMTLARRRAEDEIARFSTTGDTEAIIESNNNGYTCGLVMWRSGTDSPVYALEINAQGGVDREVKIHA